MNPIKTAIIGGAGYTAGELIRILLNHPLAEISYIHSKSHAGQPIHEAHPDLVGESDLLFTHEISDEADVIFICAGHGKTKELLEQHSFPPEIKIIDLSSDYRLKSKGNSFIYGLPELNRQIIRTASHIANPGCFATCIQLALLPLAKYGLIQNEVHIHALTGSTGAGQKPLPTTHFSWRDNNISIYKAFNHQHLDEIRQSLCQLQADFHHSINFIPVRGDFPRGIFSSAYISTDLTEKKAVDLYRDYYHSHPFTHITTSNPYLKQVVNTNKCLIHLTKHKDKLLIISMIDNLLKGASGQAVQNMNLCFGLEENLGLQLKASAL